MHDPLILEAAEARLRPFALRAVRRQAQLSGLGSLEDNEVEQVLGIIDAASLHALHGSLPDFGTMSQSQFEKEFVATYQPMMAGLSGNELAGLGSKLKKKLKKLGKSIKKGAKKIGDKVVELNKKVFKKAILPIGAPTLAHKLRQRDTFNKRADGAYQRWIASGKTDDAAYSEFMQNKAMAKKRLKTVQKHARTAAAVVATVAVAAPVIASGGGAIEAGKALVVNQLKSKAGEAVAEKIAEEIAPDVTAPQAEAAVDYAQSAEEVAAEEAGTDAQETEPKKAGLPGWLLPAAGAAALLLI